MNKTFRVSLPDGAYYDARDDENLLVAAQRAHWLVRYGCRNGNCEACAASLLRGTVRLLQHVEKLGDDNIIEAPAAKIMLCLCTALSDLQIALPSDPLPGSMEQSLRSYSYLQHQSISETESILHFTLPAGRKPALSVNQIALIETDTGLLQGHIDHENSQGRELIVKLVFTSPLKQSMYYHVRYPLSAENNQGLQSWKVDD